MRHCARLVVALAATLTVAALAGPAMAITPAGTTDPAALPSFPGPDASAKEKKRAYGRYCGPEVKRRTSRKAKDRRKCVEAMAQLAGGKASSPSAACRSLKPKRSKGRKGSASAYKRCVKGGARLVEDQRAAAEKAAALEEQQAEADADEPDPADAGGSPGAGSDPDADPDPPDPDDGP